MEKFGLKILLLLVMLMCFVLQSVLLYQSYDWILIKLFTDLPILTYMQCFAITVLFKAIRIIDFGSDDSWNAIKEKTIPSLFAAIIAKYGLAFLFIYLASLLV